MAESNYDAVGNLDCEFQMDRSEEQVSLREYRFLVLSDLYRISGKANLSLLFQNVLFGEAYQYIFWMRTCRFARGNRLYKYSIYPFAQLMLHHYTYKLGISIPFMAGIGSGLFIGHFGGIIVYPLCKIGKNCNLSQGVTIGLSNRGKNKGYPVIGDNVYIGPGAKLIGAVKIGNNVAIGANCVVTKDAPDNAVVVGVPGRIISYEGSEGYICHTDYEGKIG
jgi:serine O-acetyltransferase